MTSYEPRPSPHVQRVVPHAPAWTEGNDSDPGVTLPALFGFLAASLVYATRTGRTRADGVLPAAGAGLAAAGVAWVLQRRRDP